MLIVGSDIETTGLEPGDHKVIEFYAEAWSWEPGREPEKLETTLLRIHPQRNIPIESQRIHKITLSDLEGCPTWDKVAEKAHRALVGADMIVGHNFKGFDMPFLNHEFMQAGLPPLNPQIIDTMLDGRWATPTGKVPNLGELCFACDIPYDTTLAHSAAYDVDVMMQAFFKAVGWGWFKLPSPLSEAA